MKIERLNENQIRCTLNKEDLANRQIKISELAYGSDKAKQLFRDMMTQASNELGFEANDIPLVIEAIPVSSECIILIVTKVEDPEELDTRFAKFSPSRMSLDDGDTIDAPNKQQALHSAADILNLFKKISEDIIGAERPAVSSKPEDQAKQTPEAHTSTAPVNITKIYLFHSIEDICKYAEVIHTRYQSSNTLYKDPKSGHYYLIITKGKSSPELFNKICNIATEYGEYVPASPSTVAYYNEHFKMIIKNKAIQKLANL